MKGLLCTVLRNAQYGDGTNGGVSSTHASFILCGDGIPELFEATDDTPALILVRRTIAGEEYLHAQPLRPEGDRTIGPMFGGNFVTTSDSRFPQRYPIPVHDRFETPEDYERLSR